MSSTSNLDKHTRVRRSVYMAVFAQLQADYVKEHEISEPEIDLQREMSMKLAEVFIVGGGLEDECIESLKCEIKNMAQKAIDTVFNVLFNKKEAPDATDSLPRH